MYRLLRVICPVRTPHSSSEARFRVPASFDLSSYHVRRWGGEHL